MDCIGRSRLKRPGFNYSEKVGAVNVLVRACTVLTMTVRILRRLCYTMDWKRTDSPRYLVQGIKSKLHVTEPALHVNT